MIHIKTQRSAIMDLLIIADDFTGALDTGVQFAQRGLETKVLSQFSQSLLAKNNSYMVLVINADTRRLSGEEAYQRVRSITEAAMACGIRRIFKKTDSALRGNIGSELEAVMDASRKKLLFFAPAFPKMKRVTRDGVQYLGDKPIHLTEFGEDPYEPVTESKISLILRTQYRGRVVERKACEGLLLEEQAPGKTVVVYDTETDDELEVIAREIADMESVVMAGCAGLADALSKVMLRRHQLQACSQSFAPLLVICGSVFPVTRRQVDYAQAHGFCRFSLGPAERSMPDFVKSAEGRGFISRVREALLTGGPIVIDTMEDSGEMEEEKEKSRLRRTIADNLGDIVSELVRQGTKRTIMVIGGDTLKAVVDKLNCLSVKPIAEIFDGTVLFYLDVRQGMVPVLSKSGGFGRETLLVDIENVLSEQEAQVCYEIS